MLISRLILYINTAKYYKAYQIIQRFKSQFNKKLAKNTNTKDKYYNLVRKHSLNEVVVKKNINKCVIKIDSSIKECDFYKEIVFKNTKILNHKEFCFLNVKVTYPNIINWKGNFPALLWGYNLNYFDFLLFLSVQQNIENDQLKGEAIYNIIEHWLSIYDFKDSVMSNPYVVSLRLMNFLYYILLNRDMTSHSDRFIHIIKYLYADFFYLADNLEMDIKGNHLIKDLKALIVLGYFFQTEKSIKLADNAIKILIKELDEQIFEDGGHFERSTMYHTIVTHDIIEIIYFLKRLGINVPINFKIKLEKMLCFLDTITHPDGEISLFNDSVFNIAPRASDILFVGSFILQFKPSIYTKPGLISYLLTDVKKNSNYINLTEKEVFVAMPDTGYCSLSNSCGKMIFDCGNLGPDYLPAHAHNDMLSFELSIGNKRYIIDTGVYEYQTGVLRNSSRSVINHNTIAINGMEQSELWSSFRMGRRGRIICCNWAEYDNYQIVSTVRSQYNSKKAWHKRTILADKEGFWIVIDRVRGYNNMPHLSHLHLSPELQPSVNVFGIVAEKLTIVPIIYAGELENKIVDSMYYPEFGVQKTRQSIQISTYAEVFGYILVAFPVNTYEIKLEQNIINLLLNDKKYNFKVEY